MESDDSGRPTNTATADDNGTLFKAYCGNEIRRFRIPTAEAVTMDLLSGFLASAFGATLPAPCRLSYEDDSHDRVALRSDQDLREALLLRLSPVKLFVDAVAANANAAAAAGAAPASSATPGPAGCTIRFNDEGEPVYMQQEKWSCETCGLVGSLGCCRTCAETCHTGHAVTCDGTSPGFFCDCGHDNPFCACCSSGPVPQSDARMPLHRYS